MSFRVVIFFTFIFTLLTGCTVRSLQTSGPTEHNVRKVSLFFDATPPETIQIKRISNYAGAKITDADKQRAQTDVAALSNVIRNGFRDQFPPMAEKRGFAIGSIANTETQLKISIASAALGCSDMGCNPHLVLKGQLLRLPVGTVLWTFSSEVGGATVYSKITDEIFQTFAEKLLDAMEKDRLISGKQLQST
ncbi:MAG: hypothetical protein WAW73_00705 [Rhodoferax sp.]